MKWSFVGDREAWPNNAEGSKHDWQVHLPEKTLAHKSWSATGSVRAAESRLPIGFIQKEKRRSPYYSS